MPPFFFYGTLMDPGVLGRVIGRDPSWLATRPAVVREWRRVFVRGRPFPTLIRDPGAETDGHLVEGLSAGDVARLTRYEGAEYALVDVTAVTPSGVEQAVRTYVTRAGIAATDREWRFEDWAAGFRAPISTG